MEHDAGRPLAPQRPFGQGGVARPADSASQHGAPDALAQRPLPERARKALTIGAVCKLLRAEFPDVSISKIRYLEDQKLLAPRRTQGGYRLYSQSDVNR